MVCHGLIRFTKTNIQWRVDNAEIHSDLMKNSKHAPVWYTVAKVPSRARTLGA